MKGAAVSLSQRKLCYDLQTLQATNGQKLVVTHPVGRKECCWDYICELLVAYVSLYRLSTISPRALLEEGRQWSIEGTPFAPLR